MGGGMLKHKTRRQAPTDIREISGQGAQRRPRCGDNELVLVAVRWFHDLRGSERGECEIEKTATAIRSSPTRDAASSGAAACARRRELANRPIPRTQPGSETQRETRRWRSLPLRSGLLPPSLPVVMMGVHKHNPRDSTWKRDTT